MHHDHDNNNNNNKVRKFLNHVPLEWYLEWIITILYSLEWQDDKKWWIEKDLEGNGPGVIQILSQHLSGGTEENHEIPISGYAVSCTKFKPSTSTIRVQVQPLLQTVLTVMILEFSTIQCAPCIFIVCKHGYVFLVSIAIHIKQLNLEADQSGRAL
jgi:hypothetical protein